MTCTNVPATDLIEVCQHPRNSLQPALNYPHTPDGQTDGAKLGYCMEIRPTLMGCMLTQLVSVATSQLLGPCFRPLLKVLIKLNEG